MPGVSRRALALAGGLLLLLATVGRAVAQDAPGVEIIAVSHDPGGALTVSLFAPDGDTLREQDLVAPWTVCPTRSSSCPRRRRRCRS